MIYSITGVVTHISESSVRISAGPLEWELETSASTARSLSVGPDEVRVFTYLHHREDALSLFGFATEDERGLFLELIRVNGIGPRQATRMLSGATPSAISSAILSSDVDALARLPGIGKKTAAKIVLALAGKLESPAAENLEPAGGIGEIVDGLVAMGFDRGRAQDAARSALASLSGSYSGPELENEVFRTAVVALSKKG